VCEYEKARKHYSIANAEGGYALESSFYSGWASFEEDNYHWQRVFSRYIQKNQN
jgi:hypothetical protein